MRNGEGEADGERERGINMFVVDGKIVEADEPRYYLDEDSICYGCRYYIDEEEGCNPPEICAEGSLNSYRMEG